MKEGYTEIDHFVLESNLDSISKVEQIVDDVCQKLTLNEESYGNVLIAVSEAVTNAIVHGNGVGSTLHVDLSVSDGSEDFVFQVKDAGRGFDTTALPDPTNPDNLLNENGRGIFLMQNLADKVEFDDYGRTVNMYFQK